MLYTFAFLRPPTQSLQVALEHIPGIQGSLIVYATESLAVVVESIADLATLQSTDQALLTSALHHDRVIQALFAHTPLIPVRFGTCFPGLDPLWIYLHQHGDPLVRNLLTLGDRVEYILKLHLDPLPLPEDAVPTTGTGYLLARQQHYRTYQQAQQQRQIEQSQLVTLWPDEWQTLSPQDHEWGRYSFLMTRDQATAVQTLTEQWQQQHPHWHFTWTPPLPPYHWLNA